MLTYLHRAALIRHNKTFIARRWDEIGYYDIPACINYVLRVTRRERLVYIGHSMGMPLLLLALGEIVNESDLLT